MRVQHATGVTRAHDREMQKSFRGRFASAPDHPCLLIDLQEVVCAQRGFVEPGGSNQQAHGLAPEYGAVVSAGAERPAARVEFPAEGGELRGERSAGRRWG